MATFLAMHITDNARADNFDDLENAHDVNPVRLNIQLPENSNSTSYKTVKTISSIPINLDQSKMQLRTIEMDPQMQQQPQTPPQPQQQIPQQQQLQQQSPQAYKFEQLVSQKSPTVDAGLREIVSDQPQQQQLDSAIASSRLQMTSNIVKSRAPRSPTLTIVDLPAIRAKNRANRVVNLAKPNKLTGSPPKMNLDDSTRLVAQPSTSMGVKRPKDDNGKPKRKDKRQNKENKHEKVKNKNR